MVFRIPIAMALVLALFSPPAVAGLPGQTIPGEVGQVNPIATTEAEYQEYGRVFSDPQGCLVNGPAGPQPGTSPYAKGRACTVDYLSLQEIVEGARFLEQRFPDLVRVIRLDEAYDRPDFMSAGIGRAITLEDGTLRPYGRDRSPLYMFAVTDRNSEVPWEDRLHFAFGMSLHGPEPAGRESGPRAMEDLVTWAACEKNDARAATTPACQTEGPFPKKIVESETTRPVPTAGEALRETVSWFTLNNPDGHRMGQRRALEVIDGDVNANSLPGVSTNRGNGHGVDLNRDWPATGYTWKAHQPVSEPETRGFLEALTGIRDNLSGRAFAGGIDLHGMSNRSALSFTLLGADQRDYHKNAITVETSIRTWEDQTERLCWSPYIGDENCNGVEDDDTNADVPVADQWGTIYDTLGYTITGGYGPWMDDSNIGLGGVGINNEMSLRTDTHTADLNQTWIDGNKGLIYSLISALMFEEESVFDPTGRIAYVFNPMRLQVEGWERAANPGLPAQDDIDVFVPCQPAVPGDCGPGAYSTSGTTAYYEFDVDGPEDGVWNGGFTVRSTTPRHSTLAGGYSTASVTIERLDETTGTWVTMKTLQRTASTYNDPEPGRWRVSFGGTPNGSDNPRRLEIQFDPDWAEMSPGRLPIDVSTMDFFSELNDYVPDGEKLEALQVAEVAEESLDAFDTLVVTNKLGSRTYLAEDLGIPSDQIDAYFAALKDFAEGGGNLVLLDAALNALPELGLVPEENIRGLNGLAGFYAFRTASGVTTYLDPDTYPLARGVNVPGAAERTAGNRQAIEPVPVGYSPDGHSAARMPFWGVDRSAWEALCERTVPAECTTAATSAQGSIASVGEIPLGDGVIRIAGAMLPDPLHQEDGFSDNRFGLASYAVTYTGYLVFENLVDHRRS